MGLGRLTKQTRLIDNRSYAMETTSFDPLHRPLTIKYPTPCCGQVFTVGCGRSPDRATFLACWGLGGKRPCRADFVRP